MMRRSVRAVLALFVALTPSLLAQGTLSPTPQQQFLDANGNPVVNGKICTYLAGTTTPTATYTDSTLTIQNANPIRTDGSGRAVIYLSPGASYKYIVRTAGSDATCTTGTLVYMQDNISTVPISSGSLDITAVAGESIVAGQVVYLSDGSGSKSAGQWYLADADLVYASYTPSIGIATAAITSGNAGSVRVAGVVPNLTSLSVGASYYVSTTAGAVTVTVPAAYRRQLGQADTATSLVLSANPPPPVYVLPAANEFRLSLTTATCVTTADVTGASATTIFWTPCTGNHVTLSDSTGTLETCVSTEKSIAVPATTSTMYDVWVYDATFGTCSTTLEVLPWTNDTTRATNITRGTVAFYTKTGDLTRRFLGTFRTTTVSGQTEDSRTGRFLWNYYHRARRQLFRTDTTDSWNYTTAAWRQARADANNQVDLVIGVSEVLLSLQSTAVAVNNTADALVFTAIGEDSTTTPNASNLGKVFHIGAAATTHGTGFSILNIYPAIGRHFYTWLEFGNGAGTTTWFGDNGGSDRWQNGLSGWIEG